MDLASRFEIISTIADGQYARVCRARDHELHRDVAIKQIHPQYLQHPAQLDRYWREAQLLASLEHPYIVRVYDLVRPQGRLILELMHGSLDRRLAGRPIDLDFLRVSLVCVLHALRVLEKNGVVHGDVKPSNLLIDNENRVKLGDFGIARRLEGDPGSMIKGSTKYMAPEVVADQFGPVGPHSDLYSLGFSAFELMCGAHFDSLFPGLDTYGGNRQMAWIMWHAAPDRRLPPIHELLEGVPGDLAAVIERLIEKDPARRYAGAEEALAELRQKASLPNRGPSPQQIAEQQAQQEAEATQKRRRWTIAAVCASLVLSLTMLMIPSGSRPPASPATKAPSGGMVRVVDADEGYFILEPTGGDNPLRLELEENDRFLLAGRTIDAAELRAGDVVQIQRLKRDDGTRLREFQVERDLADSVGRVVQVDATNHVVSVKTSDGALALYVPRTARIEFNGSPQIDGRPVRFEDIHAADEVHARHVPDGGQRRATMLHFRRPVPLTGTLVAVDPQQRQVTLKLGSDSNAAVKTFSLAATCPVRLNSEAAADLQIDLAGLEAGDRLHVLAHTEITQIEAHRQLVHAGKVTAVEQGHLRVAVEGRPDPVRFAIPPSCPIVRQADGKPLAMKLLQPGDQVRIGHDSGALENPTAERIEVTPWVDRSLWAIVVAQQNYDHDDLPSLAAAQLARPMVDALIDRQRLSPDQMVFEVDSSLEHLRKTTDALLERVPADARLIFYYVGHARLASGGEALLATREFDPRRAVSTGWPLRALLSSLEKCPAKVKLLLLDTGHGRGEAAADLVEALRRHPRRGVSQSVTIVASCGPGPTSHSPVENRFVATVIEGLQGTADANGNGQLSIDELVHYINSSAAEPASSPKLFLPDPRPVRLSAQGREAVRKLLAQVPLNAVDLDTFRIDCELAKQLTEGQPDADLAGALVFLKNGKSIDARKAFQAALAADPDSMLAHQGLAWHDFLGRDYAPAVQHLEKMVRALPQPGPGEALVRQTTVALKWAGRLRAYAALVASQQRRPDEALLKAVDDAVGDRPEENALELYRAGYFAVAEQLKELDKELAGADSDQQSAQLRLKRRTLSTYARFHFQQAADYLLVKIVE